MKIAGAPRHPQGFLQARPGDVAGSDLLIIDVREEADLLDDFGHIHGVKHVARDRMLSRGLPDVPPDTPLAVVCSNGRMSADCAASLVREHGFSEVYHLVGGMVRWTAEERPVARVRTWVSV